MDLATVIRSFHQGRVTEAEAACRQLLQSEPGNPDALHLMGVISGQVGQHAEAADWMGQAIAIKPDVSDFHRNLAVALEQQGKLDDAANALRNALQLSPGDAVARCMLGNLLLQRGATRKAIECYQQALQSNPNLAMAHHNLATVYRQSGNADAAIRHYRHSLALDPRDARAANDLSGLMLRQGAMTEGITLLRQILQHQPDNATAHNNLGHAMRSTGQLEEARVSYQRALELRPDYSEAHSNLVYLQQFLPNASLAGLLDAHLDWNRQHAEPLKSQWRGFENSRDPQRRLRLGFVSPDLGKHPVAFFLVECLEALRSESCETVCYSDRGDHDEMSSRIEAATGTWRDVHSMSDEALAAQIRRDKIDVLFDLAGHTANNRLLVFARKPAPIQASWLGYVGTTGLEAMDYLVADRYVVPAKAKAFYQEKILWLPKIRLTFDPPSIAPQVGPLPADSAGYVTFASFNQPAKLTSDVLKTWAEILRLVPESRLILKYRGFDDAALKIRIHRYFVDQEIDPSRIDLRGASEHAEALAEYNSIDIALDPFPFTGGATSCESLWMGVPVVTCPMQTFVSRQTSSILTCIGVEETVASDLEDYVRIAVDLANDLPRLATLRASMRRRMSDSPLCDCEQFAHDFMKAVRGVWRDWCSAAEPNPGK